MKTFIAFVLGLSMAAFIACQQGGSGGQNMMGASTLETSQDSMSYGYGVQIGQNFQDAEELINVQALISGIVDGLEKSENKIDDQTCIQLAGTLMQSIQQKKLEGNRSAGEEFLKENAEKDGVVVLPSGLQYKVIREGNGKKPVATDQVKTHYRGTFLDGKEFDSSYKRDEPVTFPLNRVIPGWTEGLQLMSEGAKYEFYIPSNLAYGPRGNQAIPPNSTLIFEVELIEVMGK